MTNLDRVCLFSNLIIIPVQWCGFSVSVVGTQLFFYWFGVQNLLEDDQIFKMGENQISRREWLFLFYQSKLLSHFVPVSPYTTLKERSQG